MTEQPALCNTVGRALTLLAALESAEAAVGLSTLSRQTGLAKSTTHRLLSALTASGFAFRVGHGYQAVSRTRCGCDTHGMRSSLVRRLAPFLGDVLIKTGLSASLAVLSDTQVVHVYSVLSHSRARHITDHAALTCAYRSSAGRLLMAYQPEATSHIIDTWRLTPDDTAGLCRELSQIRRSGLAVMRGDHGITSVSVPLLGARGVARFALSAEGATETMDVERTVKCLRIVAEAASRTVFATQTERPQLMRTAVVIPSS